MAVDPITFEIIRHRLDSINEEAAVTLRQVSGSQVAVEANDLNTAITMADGTVVACGLYVLCQMASLDLVITDILREYSGNPGFGPGDQFITNDPYVGTLHQPDVVVVAPVFAGGQLVAWCGSTVHQYDVGGPAAGGLTSDAGSIFDEPTPLPPIRIVEGDRMRRDIERDWLRRSRTPRLNELDLRGQVAANRTAAAAIGALCAKYGTDAVLEVMNRLVDATAAQLRRRLLSLPDGTWRHVSYLERGAPRDDGADRYAVRLEVTKRGDSLEFDFTGSDEQAPGAINAAYPALLNFTVAAVLIYLCPGLPWVPGAIGRVIRIRSVEGSIVHARWPAGVAMGISAACQAIRVTVNLCLARMMDGSAELAEHAMASCASSGAGGAVFAGLRGDGEQFAAMTLDEVTGGGGATGAHDGVGTSGVTTSPGAAVANVEVNESYLPLRYLLRTELPDSGGPGMYRGGVGGVIATEPHGARGPVALTSFGQGLQHPNAAGLSGGEPGGQSVFAVLPVGQAQALTADLRLRLEGTLPLPARGTVMAAGEVHLGVTQGGGGFGDPIDRDPSLVAADVAEGAVSERRARVDYGVLLTPGGEVDQAGTDAARREIRVRRLRGGTPLPARQHRPDTARRFSHALDLVAAAGGELVCCRRCGSVLAPVGDDYYASLMLEETSAAGAAPWGASYPGAERFVIRRLYCPGCAQQVDVQVAASDDPLLRAAEPSRAPARPSPRPGQNVFIG
jgi:N-methylhydantoinase B